MVDTGAMYRAVTWRVLEEGIDPDRPQAWDRLLEGWPFIFSVGSGTFAISYEGRSLDHELRSDAVTRQVSRVSAIPAVRAWLVSKQQALSRQGGVVLEGRDIGSVVMPGAELRLFVTASLEERTRRRHLELLSRGDAPSPEEVRESLLRRDHLDSSRPDSPLQAAPGVLWLDTTRHSRASQVDLVLSQVQALRAARVDRFA